MDRMREVCIINRIGLNDVDSLSRFFLECYINELEMFFYFGFCVVFFFRIG